MNAANIQPYSRAVVKLLKGIVEKDDVVWNDLLDYQSEIQDYIVFLYDAFQQFHYSPAV